MSGTPCPKCFSVTRQEVIDSRQAAFGIRRRRKCECGYCFTTVEVHSIAWERFDEITRILPELKNAIESITPFQEIFEKVKVKPRSEYQRKPIKGGSALP